MTSLARSGAAEVRRTLRVSPGLEEGVVERSSRARPHRLLHGMPQACDKRLELVRLLIGFGRQVDLLHVSSKLLPPMKQLLFALLLLQRGLSAFAVFLDYVLVCLRPQAHQIDRSSRPNISLLLPLPCQVRNDLFDFAGELIEFLLEDWLELGPALFLSLLLHLHLFLVQVSAVVLL